jgi:hypothetical protein
MTTTATQAWLDQDDQLTVDLVRRYGWRIVHVSDGDAGACPPGCPCAESRLTGELPPPDFTYTVGLFGLGHPELLIFSRSPFEAGRILNELGTRVREGENLLPGRPLSLSSWERRIVTEQVPNPGEIVLEANRFYQRPPVVSVPVLQLSYDDPGGRFPWQPGYDDETGRQPRPGTFWA